MPGAKNDRRTIFGWAMYDWANSAYSTVIAGAVLPAYFASEVVPDAGWYGWSGESLWGLVTGSGALLLFLAMPVLGAIADYSAAKLRFMRAFAFGGALFTALLFFAASGSVALTLLLFLLAQIGFVGANVFYDGFLPDIATDDTIDRVSSKGYATGYIGGGVYLGVALALISFAPEGREALFARIGISGAGLWWAGFAVFAFGRLRDADTGRTAGHRLGLADYTRLGFTRTITTARRLAKFPQLLLFVVAFMFYNDGVNTTINISGAYAADTLRLDTEQIALTFLVVQFVAFGGALLFSWVSSLLGIRLAIQLNIAVWIGVAATAYLLPVGEFLPFLATGVVIGFVLGGIQALSRSLYGSMIPEEASAEFYGFYSVFSKFSAIWGPLIFSVVGRATGSGRNAILSILGFFILGLILFSLVDIDEARRSRTRWRFDGAEAVVE